MSAEENRRFELTNICWICSKLNEKSDDKVRDHCHISGKYRGVNYSVSKYRGGKYRGAAHRSCNINLKTTKKVPVIFHNLKGYESFDI